MSKSLILCDCLGTQAIDSDAIAEGTGLTCSKVHKNLCGAQTAVAADALQGGNALIACAQEASRFEEMAAELGVEAPVFVDIRDRAGWSPEGAGAGPKMAALVAEALLEAPPSRTLDVTSEGLCLILGSAEVAFPAAEALAEHLSVTVLVDAAEDLPLTRGYDVAVGRLRGATGTFGQFEVRIDALQMLEPGGRGAYTLGLPRDGARSDCDIILDLRGESPLFPAPEKRDGYLRADPGSPQAVAATVMAASHLIGTFEKPLYVGLAEPLCAHSRAEKEACRNCLDVCPTGAITPAGEHVAIDPLVCAGCGACAALCPSGAITYEDPPVAHLQRRISTLAEAYAKAGGTGPRLLIHDMAHGAEMISLAARFGRGLPSDVIPLALETIAGFGHAEMLAALTSGFTAVDVLLAPTTEREALDRELALATALSGKDVLRLLEPTEPDALSDLLYTPAAHPPAPAPVLAMGSRRQIARMATKALQPAAEAPIPLPEGAPYGAVLVDTEACTMCLACASLCPSGALTDNEDKPQLNFQEDACLQCGLCANVCPEDAIALQPQLDTSDAALSTRVLNEEEPYACIECGALFGVKSTVERIVSQLEGKHHMFANSQAAKMIRMCENCRVQAQYHSENNPFSGGERPAPRTTDDYYSDRKDH